jgi:hypothetical protein
LKELNISICKHGTSHIRLRREPSLAAKIIPAWLNGWTLRLCELAEVRDPAFDMQGTHDDHCLIESSSLLLFFFHKRSI